MSRDITANCLSHTRFLQCSAESGHTSALETALCRSRSCPDRESMAMLIDVVGLRVPREAERVLLGMAHFTLAVIERAPVCATASRAIDEATVLQPVDCLNLRCG